METRSVRGGRTPHFAALTAEATVYFQGTRRARVGVNVSARSLRDARPALRAGFGREKTLQKNFRWRPNVRENARCGVRACEPVEAVVALELAVHLVYVLPGGAFRRGHAPSIESARLPMPERRDAGSGQRSTEREQRKSEKSVIFTGKQSDLGTTTRKQTGIEKTPNKPKTRSLSDLAVSRSRISKRFGKSTEVWRVASLRHWKRAVARARVCLHGY